MTVSHSAGSQYRIYATYLCTYKNDSEFSRKWTTIKEDIMVRGMHQKRCARAKEWEILVEKLDHAEVYNGKADQTTASQDLILLSMNRAQAHTVLDLIGQVPRGESLPISFCLDFDRTISLRVKRNGVRHSEIGRVDRCLGADWAMSPGFDVEILLRSSSRMSLRSRTSTHSSRKPWLQFFPPRRTGFQLESGQR